MGRVWALRPNAEDELTKAVSDLAVRLKAEDHLDLPELLVHDIMVRLPRNVVPEYLRLKRELVAQLESTDILAVNAAASETSTLSTPKS
jgi:hypothetical protein